MKVMKSSVFGIFNYLCILLSAHIVITVKF